ncbi:MAG: site-specific DNA-methyltransferase, partial [Desulfobacterales bacterium]
GNSGPFEKDFVRKKNLNPEKISETFGSLIFMKISLDMGSTIKNESIDSRTSSCYHQTMFDKRKIADAFSLKEDIVLYSGDCLELLKTIPDESLKLVVTSPPYNIGKEYEKRLKLERYIDQQAAVIRECVRCLSPDGSICWQVGNYVDNGAIIPLDTMLYPIFTGLGLSMRNRIIWHFEHGLHCSRRFSGRYETIIWFTKSDEYIFNLDPIRVPQKYPGKKYFKGPNAGKYSCNPLGKNPGDLWVIPNVKSNHVEKTGHPCQFPVELIERLVLSMTNEGDRVFDPFLGTGTSIIAAIRHKRRGAGAETVTKYINLARDRIGQEIAGTLRTRPMDKPIYDPEEAGNSLRIAPWTKKTEDAQLRLLEKRARYSTK